MSSARSRNFRRRAGDDNDDEDSKPATPSNASINGTPSTANRPPATTKNPKKPSSQPPTKSLLSFADDDDESPFSRPTSRSSSSSSSRFSKSSAHKLTSSKDRSVPRPPQSSSIPSNVQPQAGTYTKEALLELQKNTKTLAAPARKPKPQPEPVIILKGLIKPMVSNDVGPGAGGKGQDSEEDELGSDRKSRISSVERDDAIAHFRDVKLESSLGEDEEVIPDRAMIEAARAKRERMRQAGPAALDYIALDGGSNHGAADGLSDEEPESRGRIGFIGDKVHTDKKGVFEEFSERSLPKNKGIEMDGDSEDEEDKMWEEEQVRKGLGKRLLDEGLGSKGKGGNIGGTSTVQQIGNLPPPLGLSGSGISSVYPSVPNTGISGNGGLFGTDVMPISQQAEIAKKALSENLSRLKESHSRTVMTLAKTEETLSSSLMNVTNLENALSAAGEKFLFMQKLRDFVSVLCEFLQHKAPFIEELEEQMQNLHEERAKAIRERRAADNEDEFSEIAPAITAAKAELRKGGGSAKVTTAAFPLASSASARVLKSAPVELDEFGRDVNLQKRMDMTRRAESRQRRRAKADSKRKLAMETNNSSQEIEGELSTDESDNENAAYESTRNQLLQVADKVFSDAADEFSHFPIVIERFERWKRAYTSSYRDAYMSLSIPAVFSPYVRLELLKWDPLHEDSDFLDMEWHSLLFNYGQPEDESTIAGDDTDAKADDDTNLIPELIERIAIPILHHHLAHCWDILSTRETKHAVSAVDLVLGYINPSSSVNFGNLVAMLRDRLTGAVSDLMVPTWSPLEMNAVPNAARVVAYRFGTSVRLMRNICLWNKILKLPVLEKIALDELLCGKVLPHLHSIQSNVHDAIVRTERVVASLCGVWAGPSVAGDGSRKLKPLVDYLLLIGKTLEKKHVSGAMETGNSTLVRRLKKMLVELNEYDHARAISRKFNLKEAL